MELDSDADMIGGTEAAKIYLRKSTVVPDVTVVGEAVTDVAQPTLLDVLLYRIERLLLGDLHLGVGPARDFNDHVEDAIVRISEQRDVVPGRDGSTLLLDEHTVLLDNACEEISELDDGI